MAEKRLYEISVLRPLLILSIIVGHCFAIYSGSWKTPEWLMQYPTAYSYVNPFFISFQLAAFTFISGYLMGYKKYRIDVNFFVKKIRRLYIPAIVFGILYLILFKKADIHGFLPFSLAVLKGVGHLWFLPMLFWCFVFVGLIESLNISWKWVLPFFLLLLFVKGTAQRYFPHLGIANSFSYLFYFYLGLLCKRYNWMHRYENLKQTTGMIAFVLFLLLFAFQIIVLEPLQIDSFLKGKLSGIVTLMICLCGIFFSLQFAKVSIKPQNGNFVQRMEWLGRYCFPVYVYHQFLILLLYYTIPPTFLPTNIIPIVVCIIVVLLSLALSYVTLHTRIGRLVFG